MWVNKKAGFDYFIDTRFEAGIKLLGWEVKSIRNGNVKIHDAYVKAVGGNLCLVGMDIDPPAPDSGDTSLRYRDRVVLLHNAEIQKIRDAVEKKGYTCVVTKLYWAKGKGILKCEVALAKGKNARDKRDVIRERDISRESSRELQRSY